MMTNRRAAGGCCLEAFLVARDERRRGFSIIDSRDASRHRTDHSRHHNAHRPRRRKPRIALEGVLADATPESRRHLRPFARVSGDGSLLYVTTVPSRLNPAGSACHPIPAYRPSACATHRPYM